MQRTVEIRENDSALPTDTYLLTTMTAGDALDIQEEFAAKSAESRTAAGWSFRIVAASLRMKPEDVRQIPWTHYQELVAPALEVNGFQTKAGDAPGEPQAGASPAA